jgi:probable HAF family extracellular repeat protein
MGIRAGLAILLGALLLSLIDGPSPRFSIVEVEPFLGGQRVYPADINNRGQVVGSVETTTSRNPRAFVWSATGEMEDLGIEVDIDRTRKCRVNDLGQMTIPAFIRNATFERWGYRVNILRSESGEIEILGGRDPYTAPVLNNLGQMVFNREEDSIAQTIFRDTTGKETVLFKGGYTLLELNDKGHLLIHGTPTVLSPMPRGKPILLIPDEKALDFTANGLNDFDQMVGSMTIYTGEMKSGVSSDGSAYEYPVQGSQACLYDDGKYIPLDGFGGESFFTVEINNRRQIIGIYHTRRGKWLKWFDSKVRRAPSMHNMWMRIREGPLKRISAEITWGAPFLWEEGEMWNLNDLIPSGAGWYLTRPTALNDRGQIVGFGVKDGKGKAFLLTPLVED